MSPMSEGYDSSIKFHQSDNMHFAIRLPAHQCFRWDWASRNGGRAVLLRFHEHASYGSLRSLQGAICENQERASRRRGFDGSRTTMQESVSQHSQRRNARVIKMDGSPLQVV